ncbi:MAG: PqqD family protein [Armatimonadetes bacterium]|nr:PqqD family protein [Armatimonadota bacterium]
MDLLKRFKKPAQKAPSKTEVLRARPLRNPAVTWDRDKQGDMVIHVPLQQRKWAARFGRLLPSSDTRHILLDDIGADVWQMCDGETTIDAIRRQITAKYKMNPKEAEASLLAHLQQLAKRKLIVALAERAEQKEETEESETASPPPTPSHARGSSSRRRKKR